MFVMVYMSRLMGTDKKTQDACVMLECCSDSDSPMCFHKMTRRLD